MHPPIHSVTHPEALIPWLALIAFGAYHGLNPGMGWLFALSLGLQQRSERAIWTSMVPITAGHFASIGLVAVLLLVGIQFISSTTLQYVTAALLIGFGLYKLFNYYRHPRWVGMKVGYRDLFAWSFLMATAHGAGLMIAPFLLNVAGAAHATHAEHAAHMSQQAGASVFFGVALHTAAMFAVMAVVAWLVYKKLSLAVLRRNWINFDLIWAASLLVVGGISLTMAAF